MKKTNLLMLAALSISCFSSCARNISSDTYVARNVGEVSTTYAGVIRSVREVCVDESGQLGGNQAGIVGGGAAGGGCEVGHQRQPWCGSMSADPDPESAHSSCMDRQTTLCRRNQ